MSRSKDRQSVNPDTVAALVQFVSRSPMLKGVGEAEFRRTIMGVFPHATGREQGRSIYILVMALRELIEQDEAEARFEAQALKLADSGKAIAGEPVRDVACLAERSSAQLSLPGLEDA